MSPNRYHRQQLLVGDKSGRIINRPVPENLYFNLTQRIPQIAILRAYPHRQGTHHLRRQGWGALSERLAFYRMAAEYAAPAAGGGQAIDRDLAIFWENIIADFRGGALEENTP